MVYRYREPDGEWLWLLRFAPATASDRWNYAVVATRDCSVGAPTETACPILGYAAKSEVAIGSILQKSRYDKGVGRVVHRL